MANKYDLKTWLKRSLLGSAAAAHVGSNVVPAGKQRFLTYIRVNRGPGTTLSALANSLVFGIASYTTSAPAATTVHLVSNLKLPLFFPGVASAAGVIPEAFVQEIRGSIEHPIISVAGGAYMNVAVLSATGSSCNVFAEYYDE